IYNLTDNQYMENELLKVEYGCPASNITQQMSPRHPEYQKPQNESTQARTKATTDTIETDKKHGTIRKDVNAKQVTIFVMSGYWGIRNLGKLENSKKVYVSYLKQLKLYLDSLK